VPSTSAPRNRLIRHRSCSSQEYAIPEGITRSRTSRFNVARPPTTETRPSRGPWLAIGFCCPDGSSLTTASSEPLNPSPPLMDSWRRLLHPRKIGLRWESRGSPIYSAGLDSRAASHTPVARKVRETVSSSSVLAFTLVSRARRPHWEFRGCRVRSDLPQELLRPASWLALLSRTFTFELAPTRSPSISVEYDYVDKQSIPTAGLSPASPTALWAAGHHFPPSPERARQGDVMMDFNERTESW
jgi:hypothetical protein